jgi:DedD protein
MLNQNPTNQEQRMIRDFTKDEVESEESVRDTEFTLGGTTLLALGGGLIVLCVLCFGLGYTVGHRRADQPVSNIFPPPSGRLSALPVGSGPKPTAAGQSSARPQAPPQDEVSTDTTGDATQPAEVVPAAANKSADSQQPQVKPAVDSLVRPAFDGKTRAASSSSTFQVMPAVTNVQGWMVQIAAVSHPDDAEVLVNALRRRGYSVTARRDNGDSLIHVQTGPFVNRNDANAMRQKLLNDGYNAIVQ